KESARPVCPQRRPEAARGPGGAARGVEGTRWHAVGRQRPSQVVRLGGRLSGHACLRSLETPRRPHLQLGHLSNSQWQRLQQAADDLVAAWERDGAARLDDFLPPASDPLRPYVLQELIKTDL